MKNKDFKLKKLRIQNDGRCDLSYLKKIPESDSIDPDTVIVSSPRKCHSDLIDCLQKLTDFLCKSTGLSNDGGVKVIGVSTSGRGKNESLTIFGTRKFLDEEIELKSPFVYREKLKFGFESLAFEILRQISQEAYLYAEKNKVESKTLRYDVAV